MNAKHTPAPWIVRYSGSGYPSAIDAPDADNKAPGKVGTSITRWNAITLPSSEEGQANAHLIAAAPELLAELEDIRNNGGFRDLRHIEQVDALIAKAKGETP